ncbi:MAG: hypothetical protein ACXVLQ_00965 [Bacteriovorax sp.]
MKANKLFFCVLAVSLLSIQSMSPTDFTAHTKFLKGRTPASDDKDAEAAPARECKAEAKGEKLEADVKKQLEDKEVVLKQFDGLKKDSSQNTSDHSELIALMSQITTMFSTQMQGQMQLQIQMMNMLAQMQNSMTPQMSPYSFNSNDNSFYGLKSPYNLNDSIGLGGWEVGIPAYNSQWSGHLTPYSIMPEITRQPAQAQSDFGFNFNSQVPALRGFDFSQTPGLGSPAQVGPSLTRIYSI